MARRRETYELVGTDVQVVLCTNDSLRGEGEDAGTYTVNNVLAVALNRIIPILSLSMESPFRNDCQAVAQEVLMRMSIAFQDCANNNNLLGWEGIVSRFSRIFWSKMIER